MLPSFALFLFSAVCRASAWEWAGIFEVPDNLYMWTAQKTEHDGEVDYVDPGMKIAVLDASDATAATLKALEEAGAEALEQNCTDVPPGGTIQPASGCYQLNFDAGHWQTLFTVDLSSSTAVAFFCEHFPTEFENTAHYLKDGVGEDVEPRAEMPEEEADKADWGASIGAAIIVNFVTLIGVVLTVPCCKKFSESDAATFEAVIATFAAGALMSCAFFLLLFEATHLIETEFPEEEVEVVWRWGLMILLGFFLPGSIHVAVSFVEGSKSDKEAEGPAEAQDDSQGALQSADLSSKSRVIAAVCLGDFFHNLCDGFAIGVAFKSCPSMAWGLTLATVLHELPQELADYAILTNSKVGMSTIPVLVINFVMGVSVVIGVIIVNSLDVSNFAQGLLLSFGGGIYLYIAAVECMPKMHTSSLSPKFTAACLFSWALGAFLIGLVLLDHEHCSEGGHDGHGH